VESIPAELRGLDRWYAWRLQFIDGKPSKAPIDCHEWTGQHVLAKWKDPATRVSFEQALTYWSEHLQGEQLSGLSFVLDGDGLVGIDLDGCRDPRTKYTAPWAQAIITRFNLYTEWSPSYTGVRIFVRGQLPPGHRCKKIIDAEPIPGIDRKPSIEVYSTAKVLSVTGRRINGNSIEDRTAELLAWDTEEFGEDGGAALPTKGKYARLQLSLCCADRKHSALKYR
jgi:primase-polymerase (primpol)-like protein